MRKCPHCGTENDDYSTFCSKCWQDITQGPIRKYASSFGNPPSPVEPLSQAGVPSPASGTQQIQKEEVQKLGDVLENIIAKETAGKKAESFPPAQEALFGKKISFPAGIKTAGFFERFQAMLIDGFVILFSVVFLRIFGLGLFGRTHTLTMLFSPVYFVFFISQFGQTPGKWFMGLKVVSEDGHSPVTVQRAFIRWVGYYVNMFFFGLGYLWIFVDPNRQGFHDKMAKTIVIRIK